MKFAYAVAASGDVLAPVADVRTAGNHATVAFYEGTLASFVDGTFRPYMLLAERVQRQWPTIVPERFQKIPGVRIWADTAKSRLDHRVIVWRGWVWPDDALGVVKPVVDVAKLASFANEQSGFLQSFESKLGFPFETACSIPGCMRTHPPAVPICGDHFAQIPAAERTRYWNDKPGRLAMLSEWRRRLGDPAAPPAPRKARKARPLP